MPKSALPLHLQNFDWAGTDNASWLMRQKKKIQMLLAAGPRVPNGFFKWREYPKLLLYIHGCGFARIENTNGIHVWKYELDDGWGVIDFFFRETQGYLSRIQPWVRWHISLQWPLFFNCHVIYRQKNVVVYPTYQSTFGITKMFTFGFGFKRDGDKVYWLTANMGGNFE